jgi:hypothetical protein
MAKEAAKVKAVVVRGSFWTSPDADGNRRHVVPGQGKDSEVEVTPTQLAASVGILVEIERAEAEMKKVAAESIAPPTPTAEATTAPSDAASSRRNR